MSCLYLSLCLSVTVSLIVSYGKACQCCLSFQKPMLSLILFCFLRYSVPFIYSNIYFFFFLLLILGLVCPFLLSCYLVCLFEKIFFYCYLLLCISLLVLLLPSDIASVMFYFLAWRYFLISFFISSLTLWLFKRMFCLISIYLWISLLFLFENNLS